MRTTINLFKILTLFLKKNILNIVEFSVFDFHTQYILLKWKKYLII